MGGTYGTCRGEDKRNAYRVLVGKPEGDILEDISVHGRIILK
jgi:hypothetical protein